MTHSSIFETMCNSLKVSTAHPNLSKVKISGKWVFLQNFRYVSYKRVLYSVLHASMTHTDAFEKICDALKALKYQQYLQNPSSRHTTNA